MADDRLGFATTDQFVGMIRSDPVMELVWENGQVLARRLSGSPSCVSHPLSQKFQAKNDQDMFSAKTRRSDHYSGQKESSKLEGSLQHDHHAGLFPGLHQNDFNLFFESTRNFDGGVESQVVPVCKNASSKKRFEFVAENPHLAEASNVPAAKFNQRLVPELQNQDTGLLLGDTMSSKMKFLAEPQKELPHDEQYQSAAHKNTAFQYCPDIVLAPVTATSAANRVKENYRDQLVETTSMCSRASNDMACNARRRNEDNDLSTSPSKNVGEEKASSFVEAYRAGQRGHCKRKRSTEEHNISEKKRRAKINKKMRELQELIPNADKVDEASMLDQAIEYLKNLQLQVQIMQMARSLCTHSMMLSSGMQQIQAPQLGHLFSSLGMGMYMGGVGCNPSMFTVPPVFGLPGHMLPMPPLPQPPFIPFTGGSSGNAIVAVPHDISGLATPGQLLGPAPVLR